MENAEWCDTHEKGKNPTWLQIIAILTAVYGHQFRLFYFSLIGALAFRAIRSRFCPAI